MVESTVELSTEVVGLTEKAPIHVLHVDDEPAFLKVAQECLQMQGAFEVDTALSVKEATEKMNKKTYDAVVCDYQMPEKDGLQFLQEVRKSGSHIPFILFTGKGREEVAIKAVNLGADGFINKTGDPETVYCELAHSIRQAVDRRRAEIKLKMSEEKYRNLFENAHDGILLLDLKGNITDVNKPVLEYGFKKDEIIGRNVTEFVSWKDRLRLLKEIAQKALGKSVENKIEISTSKGKILVTYRSKAIIIDNCVVGIQTILRDITKQKEAEEKYRTVFENTGAATCILEEDKTISLVNKQFEKLSGYSKEEIEGKKKWTEFVTKEYLEKMLEYHRERRKKGGKAPKHYTFDAANKKGEVRNILLTIDVIPGTKKSVASIIDITEQKQIKEQLRELEEKYRSMIEQAPDSIITFDVNGVVTSVNTAAVEMSGFSKDEVIGKHFSELRSLREEDIQKFLKMRGSLLEGKVPKPFEVSFLRKDGTTAFGEGHVSIIREGGRITGFQAITRDITERKKTEEVLRQEREMLEKVTGSMSVGLGIISKDYRVLWANKVLKSCHNYVEGGVCFQIFSQRNSICPGCGVKEIFETGKDEVFNEQIVPGPDGQHTWLGITATPIRDEKGNITAALELIVPINERKQMELELKRSEEKYRQQFEEAFDAIFLADAETGIIIDCNCAATKLVGREKLELIGQHQRILHPPEKIEGEFSGTFKQHRQGKNMYSLEDQIITKNGEIKDVIISATIFEMEGKRILQGAFRDITEQKKAEKALREAEEKYRETIVNANVGIVAYDAKGEVKIINPKMEEMTGFTSTEIPTLTEWFEKLYPNEEERRKVGDKWFKRMSEEGEVKEGHAIITMKDGKRRNFLFNGVQLKSGDYLAFAQDITERKEAEEKLNKLINELAMVNEKLGVVGKWARHDARNKLSVIKSNAYLAKKKLPSNHIALKYLSEVELACDQIVQIFDFAATYEMLGVEERSYVDVEKSVEEAVSLSSGLNGVKVINDCRGLMVLADPQLKQLFHNLIDNSLKHGEKVSLIRVYYEEGKDKLKMVYEDNGIGISNDVRRNLFREGYGKGTGYGLYLMAKLCKMYGWTIQETGKYGKGAQFTITIPKMNEKGKTLYKLQK